MTTRREFNGVLWRLAGLAAVAGCATPPRVRSGAVDTHAHVFHRELQMPDRRRAPSGYDALPEAYLRLLDEHALERGVLVQPSFLGTDNGYLVAVLRRYPARLRGIAVVLPDASRSLLDELQSAGVVGIRLNLIGLPIPDFSAPPWPSLLADVKRRDWQVEVHREARDLPQIVGPLLGAGVNVVVDHFGRPDPQLGVDDPGFRYLLTTASSGRVWVKLAAAYRNGADGRGDAIARTAAPLLRAAFGPERLLWGSDWPHTLFEKAVDYTATRKSLDAWIPGPDDRRRILAETPARLFRF